MLIFDSIIFLIPNEEAKQSYEQGGGGEVEVISKVFSL